MTWTRSLIDTQKISYGTGVDLYIRVAHLELDTDGDVRKIVTITVIIGTFFISIFMYLLWRWMAKHKARRKKVKGMLMLNREAHKKFPSEDMLGDNLNQVKGQELPLFDFVKLASATNDFHESNKLGQGGFGPVYRGKLSDAQVIAIKRLSKTSEQGLEEFMNEVLVISKLQHRNLVRILGCCVEREERMLIYEYMPNKSLDAFLFDSHKQKLLDWRKRFNIIEGIGRDFGMARIFGSNEDQATTNRVVGTYGYMSPEYAMEGRFSDKLDVFSFGVLLLEILSGRRNSSFYHDKQSVSLLGHAWKLWKSDNIGALIDPIIFEPCYEMEILRCWHQLISDHSFIQAQLQKQKPIVSGFIFQGKYQWCNEDIKTISYIPVVESEDEVEGGEQVHQKVFDFLPEDVVMLASCNGLVCCQSCFPAQAQDPDIYVCNPSNKEWIKSKSTCALDNLTTIGLVFDPTRDPIDSSTKFKLVRVRQLEIETEEEEDLYYTFAVYSSENGAWTQS
ncbi:hypothetical protein CMV_015842 [Castanea mollissima]|uniref:Protein kinase domain-containing protein n=1 Tax=Castanea mollissima TaxID=60419 RepID=A0A8J4VJR4_9ROSI|nr:hypothetical protein CMV_015842 [Castanea mollissima]